MKSEASRIGRQLGAIMFPFQSRLQCREDSSDIAHLRGRINDPSFPVKALLGLTAVLWVDLKPLYAQACSSTSTLQEVADFGIQGSGTSNLAESSIAIGGNRVVVVSLEEVIGVPSLPAITFRCRCVVRGSVDGASSWVVSVHGDYC